MKHRSCLLAALTLGLVVALGAPASADPPHAETLTGDLAATSTFAVERVAGPVLHLDIAVSSQLSGGSNQAVTEHYECVVRAGVARCVGTASATGAEGESASHINLMCDALNQCTGKTRFRGVDATGAAIVGTGSFTTSGDGTGSYTFRVLHPGA